MDQNEKLATKWCVIVLLLKRHSHLTKAYLFLGAATFYGIRAAREANDKTDEALEKLHEERQRPVIAVELAP